LLPWSHFVLGMTTVHLGRYKEARGRLRQGLALAQEMDILGALVGAYWGLGVVAIAEEMYTEAQRWLRDCVSVQQETGDRGILGRMFSGLGHVARGLGQLSQAREHLRAALQVAIDIQDVHSPLWALPIVARFLVDLGQVERAIDVYALASRYPFVANSRWFEDIVGKHITAAAQALPPEVVAEAQERGRTRDLWSTARELLAEMGG
jgi:tetratricopeptide (TPR) repeat protein